MVDTSQFLIWPLHRIWHTADYPCLSLSSPDLWNTILFYFIFSILITPSQTPFWAPQSVHLAQHSSLGYFIFSLGVLTLDNLINWFTISLCRGRPGLSPAFCISPELQIPVSFCIWTSLPQRPQIQSISKWTHVPVPPAPFTVTTKYEPLIPSLFQ